jgi:hypothetical protein
MLLQTNSYVVPKEKRGAHASLLLRFREALARLGCDIFEIYEQVGTNWDASQSSGRYVQILRFRDREHQLAVQAAENSDRDAQLLIAEFCELINFPYQQEHGFFAVGFYTNILLVDASEPAVDDGQIGESGADYLNQDSNESIAPQASPMRLVSDDPFEPEEEVLNTGQATESDIASVLDAGLSGDALDVPLAADLFEEDPVDDLPPSDLRIAPKQPSKKVSGRR